MTQSRHYQQDQVATKETSLSRSDVGLGQALKSTGSQNTYDNDASIITDIIS